MSIVTEWAKMAFLSGLGGVTGGTLTVSAPTAHTGSAILASWMRP